MHFRLTLLAALAFMSGAAPAAVQVIVGPTPIPAGNARAAGDITVVNERLAFALAVESSAPYGVPRGALVDLAPVSEGTIGRDRVVFADFIPNNWSAWPNTYQRVEVLERGPQLARVRAVRDFGSVRIETLYTLRAGADRIELSTIMTNEGTTALPDLLSGLTLWPSSGYLFPVPGLAGVNEGDMQAALARRVSAYDADWAITLHAPYADHIGSGSRDMFLRHTLGPHASRTFTGTLEVSARGDLAPALGEEIVRQELEAGTVSGSVLGRDGTPLADPVVVVERNGVPYGWTLGAAGRYQLQLPVGEYTLYATGRNYSRSASAPVSITAGAAQTRDFGGLAAAGKVAFDVRQAGSDTPLDARIVIEAGDQPLVEYLGHKTFFTELESRGRLTVAIAPGSYRFRVSSGGGFLAPDASVGATVRTGAVTRVTARIAPLFAPKGRGWYAADLHHHADQAEAVTPPPDLARSELAAGLDLLFVSDHDATVNHGPLAELARARHVPLIPGIELSPSWGHFNAYPLAAGAELKVDTSTASVQAILAEARREGAQVVQVNHPFIPFGYFSSVAAGTAPGGFAADFDLMEINSSVPGDDEKVLRQLWRYWNEGKRYYLSAGSDTHNVWGELSGRVRVFVHVEGPLSADTFAAALKSGHAYVSYGPIIYPAAMFGEELKETAGRDTALAFELGSVAGLKKVELIGDGAVRDTRTFAAAPKRTRVTFHVPPGTLGWCALVVEDAMGRHAYSDPVWLVSPPGEVPR